MKVSTSRSLDGEFPAASRSTRRRQAADPSNHLPASPSWDDGGTRPQFALVFSSPLLDHCRKPLSLLDTTSEVSEVFGALRRSERKLHVTQASANARNLRSLLTDGVVVLHYCGHGLLRPRKEGQLPAGSAAVPPDGDPRRRPSDGTLDAAFCLVLEV